MFVPLSYFKENTEAYESASSKNVTEFKYLGMTPTYQNFIHKEIASRLHSRMLAIIKCTIFTLPNCY
jgi:hypothetical protein